MDQRRGVWGLTGERERSRPPGRGIIPSLGIIWQFTREHPLKKRDAEGIPACNRWLSVSDTTGSEPNT